MKPDKSVARQPLSTAVFISQVSPVSVCLFSPATPVPRILLLQRNHTVTCHGHRGVTRRDGEDGVARPGQPVVFLFWVGQHSVSFFAGGQHFFLCLDGDGQRTRGPPRVTKALATPL